MEKEKKVITQEMIETFLNGHDPQERIVNLEYNNKEDFVSVYYRNENDEKCISKQPFYPFLWATHDACLKLCHGDRGRVRMLLNKYGIKCEALRVTNDDGKEVKDMVNGYRYIFRALRPMSYNTFLKFFKDAENPVYKDWNENQNQDSFTYQGTSKKESNQYICCTPQEQFLMATGKRFFKGYDDYDQLLRLIYDLEATGLDTTKDRIVQIGVRFNRPVKIPGTNEYRKFEKVIYITGDTEEERKISEIRAIEEFIQIIYTFNPDIITAHNGENYDWNMIINTAIRLGLDKDVIAEISAKYFKGKTIYKKKRESILKLGGEIEKFQQTIVPGTIITDSLHAVRRAQATDSNFLLGTLKYATKYLGLKKENRVYTPGNKISEILADEEEHYAFNEKNGDWYYYEPDSEHDGVMENKTLADFESEYKLELDCLETYFNDDNYTEYICSQIIDWLVLQAKNASVFSVSDISEELIDEWKKDIPFEKWVEIVRNKVETPEQRLSNYQKRINEFKPGKDGDKPFIMYKRKYIRKGYKLVTGKYIVERYLLDDLWECDKVEYNLNGTDFMLCKIIPVPFQRCCTMGTAGQWKAIMMAWSYENGLAIPMAENTGKFTGGLSRLLSVGWKKLVAKFDYNSLYPSIILTWAISDENDLMGAMLHMLEYVLTTREKYKKLKKKAEKIKDAYELRLNNGESLTPEEMKEYQQAVSDFKIYDNRQMSVKKLGNSFFGSYGSNNGQVFPWKSVACAERTTCTGRMALRLMIYFFNKLGYEPVVGDTDGFDFCLPVDRPYRYTDENPYISPGLSRETEAGKKYVGYKADVAEFNDLFMSDKHYAPNAVNKMGLGIDEVLDASINFSRKNYCCWFPEKPYPEDVKRVGNTIKSKKMPEYIERFLDKGVRLLLQGKGQEFLNEYYAYIDDIYNYRIPLKQIASKGKIKKTIAEYQEDCKTLTKAGRPKSKQAWMELAIRNNVDVSLGDTLYYINIGKTKSQSSDLKTVKHYYLTEKTNDLFAEERKVDAKTKLEKEYKTSKNGKLAPEDIRPSFDEYIAKYHPEVNVASETFLNCILLPTEVIESEDDVFCEDGQEYNVPKYIEQFNNRIKALLVNFSPDIRSKIVIKNPSERPYFTEEECKLCSGFPNKPGDQDTYEQLMTMEDKEIRFWLSHPEWKIPYLEECGMNWDDIVADYNARMAREKELGINNVREAFFKAIEGLTEKAIEEFEEDGKVPDCISNIVDVDPITGDFVHKEYADITIGTIYDIFDAVEAKQEENAYSFSE